jgi:P27 family predicted phage terminase small subunit
MAKRGPKARTAENSRPTSAEVPGQDWTPPDYLSDRARCEFARVASLLAARGVLDKTDVRQVELFAMNYDLARHAYELIRTEGPTVTSDRGNVSEHPAVTTLNSATIRLKAIANDLGLTPASSRHANPSHGSKQEDDPWAGLLKVTG